MPDLPQPTTGRVGEVDWTLRPEWLAGRYWWRVVVAGHPKLLMRDHELAVQAAEAVAADEHRFRREAVDAGQ